MRHRGFTTTLAGITALAALCLCAGPATAADQAPATTAATAGPAQAQAAPAQAPARPGAGHQVEAFAEDGAISRTRVPAASPFTAPQSLAGPAEGDGTVTQVVHNGSTAAKLDVVVIGDGYTAAEQGNFLADAARKWQEITAVEPYTTYRALFNVWAVQAVSAQSGVSGDPDRATVRQTALGSYFWCEDTERLLCVDTDAVDRYAAKAPQADLVLVVANSAKYGGAGYNDVVSPLGYSGIATVSGGNDRSGQVAVHETGHSLGLLADEYFYDGQGAYQGEEPTEANSTTLTADQLRRSRTKWYRWLGRTSPDGGTVGAYEGGGYYPTGLYRPTDNSIMRSLGREFNLPGREAMIAGFYRYAATLASPTPTTTLLTPADRLAVELPAPGTRLRWYLDGRELTALRDRTDLAVGALHLTGPKHLRHRLTAVATDPTPAVIDPALRRDLTDTLSWEVTR
ncbi:M64 family metallopeptidase [Kitasatospora sp. NPDC048239]|uniref:M64 family metallopeptidase n=1 Tax=Kitasatospora sp. NPDC048239 TaxID=3364046 RepID=UPI00371D8196